MLKKWGEIKSSIFRLLDNTDRYPSGFKKRGLEEHFCIAHFHPIIF
jgi:hypothetical protein